MTLYYLKTNQFVIPVKNSFAKLICFLNLVYFLDDLQLLFLQKITCSSNFFFILKSKKMCIWHKNPFCHTYVWLFTEKSNSKKMQRDVRVQQKKCKRAKRVDTAVFFFSLCFFRLKFDDCCITFTFRHFAKK